MKPSPDHGPNRNSPSGVQFWLLLAIGAGLLFAYATKQFGGGIAEHAGERHPGVGSPLLHLSLEPLTGGEPAIIGPADIQGKIALVDYWGTWCPPCVGEIPELLRLAAKYRDEPRFRFISVSVPGGRDESVDELRESTESFLRSLGSQTPTYYDPKLATFQAILLTGQIDQGGFPTTVLIDAQGRIRGLWEGATDGKILEIDRMVERLLQNSLPAGR